MQRFTPVAPAAIPCTHFPFRIVWRRRNNPDLVPAPLQPLRHFPRVFADTGAFRGVIQSVNQETQPTISGPYRESSLAGISTGEQEIGLDRPPVAVIVHVVHPAEPKSPLAQPGDHFVGQRLTGVQLHEGAFRVHVGKPVQQVLATAKRLQLISLHVHLEQCGGLNLRRRDEIAQRGYADDGSGDFRRAGEQGNLSGGDGQQGGRIVPPRDVDGRIPGRRADRDFVQRHPIVAREHGPERCGSSGQRLKGEDPCLWQSSPCNEGKLPAVRANVDHGAAIEPGKNAFMLHPRPNAMAQQP